MKKLTEGNIYKTFILFSIPMVLSGLLSQAYHLIDTMIAGQFLGESGLAAIGATSSLITFISMIFSGYGNGFSVYIAHLYGAGMIQKIKRGVTVHLLLHMVLCILVVIPILLFHEPLFDLFQVEETLRHDAFVYLSIYLSGLCFINFTTNGMLMLNALGISSYPFFMSILSAVVNITGNILSVAVFGLGVAGIAISTVLSAMLVTLCYVIRLRKCFRDLDPKGKKLHWSLRETRQGASYALPTMLQQISMYLAGLVLAPILNSTGSTALASYVVSSQILSIVCTMYQNAARTVTNYTAQGLGESHSPAEKRTILRRGVRVGFLQGLLFTLPPLLVLLIFTRPLASLFFAEGTAEECISLTIFFIRVFLPFVLFKMLDNLFHSFFRGVKAMHLVVLGTVWSSLVQIAASWICTLHFGINGYYMGMVISWIAEAALITILYVSGAHLPPELKKKKQSKKTLSNALQ